MTEDNIMTEEQELQFLLKNWKKIPIVSTKLIMKNFPKIVSPWKHWNNVIDVLKENATQETEISTKKQIESIQIDDANQIDDVNQTDDANQIDDVNQTDDANQIDENTIDEIKMKININLNNITETDDLYNIDYRTDVSDMDSQSICSFDDNWN